MVAEEGNRTGEISMRTCMFWLGILCAALLALAPAARAQESDHIMPRIFCDSEAHLLEVVQVRKLGGTWQMAVGTVNKGRPASCIMASRPYSPITVLEGTHFVDNKLYLVVEVHALSPTNVLAPSFVGGPMLYILMPAPSLGI